MGFYWLHWASPTQLLHTHPWGLWACHQSHTFFVCIALGLPQPIFTFFTSYTAHGFATQASSALLLTLYSHGFLLTSLGFPDPITSYSSLGFMGLPSIPYSLCLHCFGLATAHFYFFHIIRCSWVCYSLFLSFQALLSSFAFSRPIYLFHGPVIHYSCCLDLVVFVLRLLPTFLCCWVGLPFLHLGFTKKKKTLNNYFSTLYRNSIVWVWFEG